MHVASLEPIDITHLKVCMKPDIGFDKICLNLGIATL